MKVEFGKYSIQTSVNDNKTLVYDIIRKKWVILTPEEQVRQVWIHYIVYELKISSSKIAVEKGLKINNRLKRFDICIYNEKLEPEILIECKAPSLPLILPNFEQLSIYNIELKANKFILSNGVNHQGYELKEGKIIKLDSLL